MIVLDNYVYSLTMWDWYHRKKETVDFEKTMDDEIIVFQEALFMTEDTEADMDRRDSWPNHYYQLDAGQLWELTMQILEIALGVSPYRVDPGYTKDEIRTELDKLERALLWWAFVKGIDKTRFGNLDYLLIDDKNQSMNQNYRFKVYYIVNELEETYSRLDTMLSKMHFHETKEMKRIDKTENRHGNYDESVEYVRGLIRISAADDADEFILYAIADFQNEKMTNNHEKLCQLERFQKFQMAEFEEKLPPGQIWASLFMNVFDGKDEVLEVFLRHFSNIAILYFLKDYTGILFNIECLPWYAVYSDDNGKSFSEDLHNLIEHEKVDKRIQKLVKSYQNS